MKQKKLAKTFESKSEKASRMLTIYYSGDKPNPNLRQFVEEHVKEHSYDPENDKYNVQAFNKPIKTTKATAIYNMHTYWSKKPHTAITQYIKHYTNPGDLVLDPMCGSGGTALTALMEGRKAIAIDLSPAATFITKNYCTPVNLGELQDAFDQLKENIESEINWLYETRCDECAGKATTVYTVYSQRFQCPRCLEVVPLFDCIEAQVPTKTKNKDKKVKMKKAKVCPYCNKRGHIEEINTSSKQFGPIPVLICYECSRGCKPKRKHRRYNDENPVKREYFEKYDLGKIRDVEAKVIPYWIPPHRMMNIESDTKPWGDKWRAGTSNFRTVAELYTKRNLWALATIKKGISELETSDETKYALMFCWSSISLNVSKMTTNRDRLGFLSGTYYLPQECRCTNVLHSYSYKFNRMKKGWKFIKNIPLQNLIISTQSANNLKNISSNSIDYIFTDPPYGGNVQYGELNFVWEAWLEFNTFWHEQEIIVNETRNIEESQWINMLKHSMRESYRVLKPGRWISLCYHDTSEGTWKFIQDLMTEVGFIPDRNESALYIDTDQKTYNQKVADKVTKRDLVINFRKPKPGETSSLVMLTGKEDSITFNKKASTIICEFLLENPGSTKDRIYDELVSRMVRRGEMQAHNFNDILIMVAEPSAVMNGSMSVDRWYLKGGDIEGMDVAESAKEEVAAVTLNKFIEGYLRDHPESEGVHFSDLFEHYIYAVNDKPRRELRDWLLDYFFVTDEGTYRPPITDEEKRFKKEGRNKGLNRCIKRFVAYLTSSVPIPERELPENSTLVEWVLHSRRAGLYFEGKMLFEKAGLILDNLSEETRVELEEAYQTCIRISYKT